MSEIVSLMLGFKILLCYLYCYNKMIATTMKGQWVPCSLTGLSLGILSLNLLLIRGYNASFIRIAFCACFCPSWLYSAFTIKIKIVAHINNNNKQLHRHYISWWILCMHANSCTTALVMQYISHYHDYMAADRSSALPLHSSLYFLLSFLP